MALVFFRVNTLIMIIIKKTEVKLISKKFYLGIRISRSALINSCGTAPSPSNKKVEKQSTCYCTLAVMTKINSSNAEYGTSAWCSPSEQLA